VNCAFTDGQGQAMELSTIEQNDATWLNPAVF